jgi:hypothetical protein
MMLITSFVKLIMIVSEVTGGRCASTSTHICLYTAPSFLVKQEAFSNRNTKKSYVCKDKMYSNDSNLFLCLYWFSVGSLDLNCLS